MVAIIVLAVMVAVAVEWRAPGLSLSARDALLRVRGILPPPDEVAIVAIDEASIRRFGRFPWPRTMMAHALTQISSARPRVIALSVLFSDPAEEAGDAALASAVRQAGNVVLAAQLIETPMRSAEWLRPLPALEQAAAGVGHGNMLSDYDGVARALTLRAADDDGEALWALAAQTLRVGEGFAEDEIHEVPNGVKIGTRLIPIEPPSATALIHARETGPETQTFHACRMELDFLGPTGSFAANTFSIADVMDGRVAPERLRDKFVLVGATAAAMGDRLASPFARFAAADGNQHGTLMPGVEVLANAVTTILRSRFYTHTADWALALIAVLVAALTLSALALAQGKWETLKQVCVLAGLAGLIVLSSYLFLAYGRIILPVVPALVALLVAAPLALLRHALVASASLDARISELREGSVRRSSVKLEAEPEARTVSWLPHGTEAKAEALARLQQQLLARTRLMDRALQSVEDGLLISDAQGRIAFANPRAAQILGVQQTLLPGSSLFERLNTAEHGLMTTDQALANRLLKETFSRLLIDRASIEREITIGVTQPGHYLLRIAPVSADPATNGANPPLGFVATLADITKQHELRQTRNDVMALVTHEMKTPLTAIKGMSEVLLKFDAGPERQHEMHQTIHEAAQRLTRMIDEYLDLTRLESGAHPLHLSAVRLATLCEQTLLLLDPMAAERGMRLVRRFSQNLQIIFADADLVSRALTNLVANAIKYGPANSEVVVSARPEGKFVLISVYDAGSGIPPEHRARIFEKFYRIPRIEDADTPGTGLGLAMVREIAELHGGHVTVESTVGAGSTFTLWLSTENTMPG